MTQLLISVKNVEEALIARYADVDLIDLKDPSVGALGALSEDVVKQVVCVIDRSTLVSATVGEGHQTIDALITDIEHFASLGVDIVKIAVSDLFKQNQFFAEMHQLSACGIKLVAVFFADSPIDLNLIPELHKAGFYGAMLDTQIKQHSLLDVQSTEELERFVDLTKSYQLVSGLAGSVHKDHLETLLVISPVFIGLRGGVCHSGHRMLALNADKVGEVKRLLLNYNGRQSKVAQEAVLGLHI